MKRYNKQAESMMIENASGEYALVSDMLKNSAEKVNAIKHPKVVFTPHEICGYIPVCEKAKLLESLSEGYVEEEHFSIMKKLGFNVEVVK